MLEHFVREKVDVHVRHNGFALHWYKDNWHVIPIGRPMMEEVYCGKNLEKALLAMGGLTKRAADVCPVCKGLKIVRNDDGLGSKECSACNGTGQRR